LSSERPERATDALSGSSCEQLRSQAELSDIDCSTGRTKPAWHLEARQTALASTASEERGK